MSKRPLPLVASLLVLLGAVGASVACAPTDEEGDADQGGAAVSSKPTDPTAADFDLDIPQDKSAGSLLRDDLDAKSGIENPPDRNFAEDLLKTATDEQKKLAQTPLEYGKKRAKAPRKFAAATVLAAMRRVRRYYNITPYSALGWNAGATANNPTTITLPGARGVSLQDYTSLSIAGSYGELAIDTPHDKFRYGWMPTGGGEDIIVPAGWSEVMAHFFRTTPNRRHGCWSTASKAMVELLTANGGKFADPFVVGQDDSTPGLYPTGEARSFRNTVNAICTGQKAIRPELLKSSNWATAMATIPIQMSVYNLLWVDVKASPARFVALPENIRNEIDTDILKETTTTDPSAVSKLTSVKFAEAQRKAGNVNVWDYIMVHQLYAFDWEQMQAVINAFYADNKQFSGDKTAFDPNNVADCNSWRAVRNDNSSPVDATAGTHCRSDKTMAVPILASGF